MADFLEDDELEKDLLEQEDLPAAQDVVKDEGEAAAAPSLKSVDVADNASYKAMLRQRIKDAMDRQERAMQYDAKMGGTDRAGELDLARKLGLSEAMMKAASQFGSIGGKMADASPVSEFSNRLLENQKMGLGMQQRDQANREKLQQYLLGKMLDQQTTMTKGEAAALEGKRKSDEAAENRKFQQGLSDARNKAAVTAAGIKAKAAKDIADAKNAKEKDAKPDQVNSAMYGRRVEQAEQDFERVAQMGYDTTGLKAAAARSDFYPENFKSEAAKTQDQAERNFVNAVLRRESGSAISKDEFANAEKQYFPRAGDTPNVLAQKKRNRAIALEGLKVAAGPAWDKVQLPPDERSPVGEGGSGKAIAGPSQGGKIKVSNGTETLMIDPSDLEHAKADGYKVVK